MLLKFIYIWLLKSSAGPKSPLQDTGFAFCNAGFTAYISNLTVMLHFPFPFRGSYVHLCQGMDTEKKKKSFLKPWRKQKLQVATVIDEQPRKCGLPVSDSEPDCHSHFFYVFFKLMFNSPRVVISQSKPKRAKSEMQSCLPNMPQKRQGGSFKRGGGEGGRDRMQVLLTYFKTSYAHHREKLSNKMS